MQDEKTTEIGPEDYARHPAVFAWMQIRPSSPMPTGLETIKGTLPKRVVFRLKGTGPAGADVIAKRCYRETGSVERILYEEILPQLPLTVPRYFGYLEENSDYSWLFLEDVGSDRFSPSDEIQRRAAARWLGSMHIGALTLTAASHLPDRGPGHYLEHLQSGRQTILENLDNPVFNEEHLEVLTAVVDQCEVLESNWQKLTSAVQSMPCTLVHGDFRPKNIGLRTRQNEVTLLPLDWEMSGWGTPIVDLAPARHYPEHAQVDLESYLSIVQDQWNHLDMATLDNLVTIGHIFRRVAAINWASMSLEFAWPEKPVGSLKIYHDELLETVPMIL